MLESPAIAVELEDEIACQEEVAEVEPRMSRNHFDDLMEEYDERFGNPEEHPNYQAVRDMVTQLFTHELGYLCRAVYDGAWVEKVQLDQFLLHDYLQDGIAYALYTAKKFDPTKSGLKQFVYKQVKWGANGAIRKTRLRVDTYGMLGSYALTDRGEKVSMVERILDQRSYRQDKTWSDDQQKQDSLADMLRNNPSLFLSEKELPLLDSTKVVRGNEVNSCTASFIRATNALADRMKLIKKAWLDRLPVVLMMDDGERATGIIFEMETLSGYVSIIGPRNSIRKVYLSDIRKVKLGN